MIGIDEAGRGALAGPMSLAAVRLPRGFALTLNDSKKLSPKKRSEFAKIIKEKAEFAIVFIPNEVIDKLGIRASYQIALKALCDAFCDDCKSEFIVQKNIKKKGAKKSEFLLDGVADYGSGIATLKQADAKVPEVMAASILAKTERDFFMSEQVSDFAFAKHKGYGTALHLDEIKRFGLSCLHRFSFCKNFVAQKSHCKDTTAQKSPKKSEINYQKLKNIYEIPSIFDDFFASEKGEKLLEFLESEYQNETIFPAKNELFRCFALTPNPSVIIIAQDPYHDGSADGLAFSSKGKIPPSLKNIYKEIAANHACNYSPKNADLSFLANQGVLLLNASLSVIKGKANSHERAWRDFFDYALKCICKSSSPQVFMLWGNFARAKSEQIAKLREQKATLILSAAHPSPLARGAFFGNEHFLKCNEFLQKQNCPQINWLANNDSLF